jgi:death-on-curing family protein
MKTISITEVKYIAFRLAQELLSFNEPIPEFGTRFPDRLEGCLAAPFQSFSGKSLYPDLVSRASILFYLMIKNHPFQNGNKRIAMTTLFVFLHKNGKWLKADVQELHNFTMWIAQSPPAAKDESVSAIEKFLKSHIVAL